MSQPRVIGPGTPRPLTHLPGSQAPQPGLPPPPGSGRPWLKAVNALATRPPVAPLAVSGPRALPKSRVTARPADGNVPVFTETPAPKASAFIGRKGPLLGEGATFPKGGGLFGVRRRASLEESSLPLASLSLSLGRILRNSNGIGGLTCLRVSSSLRATFVQVCRGPGMVTSTWSWSSKSTLGALSRGT